MFWFVLLLIIMGGAFYFYQRMRALEQQIRAEQAREKEQQQAQQQSAAVVNDAPAPSASPVNTEPVSSSADDLSVEPVVNAIQSQPGMLQADIYAKLPQLGKRQIQQLIRQLEEEGKVRRERSGSTYQLYLR